MGFRSGFIVLAALAPVMGQAPAQPAPVEAISPDADILETPQDFRYFIVKAVGRYDTPISKARGLAMAFFTKREHGGLGLEYDNSRTRTVAEVWRDRKANCISLTATYVAACRLLGISISFAEAPSISLWVRQDGMIYNERHMVALIQAGTVNLLADFGGVPAYGSLRVNPIPEVRFRSLFHSNQAVEQIEAGDFAKALEGAQDAIKDDGTCGAAWNVLGVTQQKMGDLASAEASFRKALEVERGNGAACGNLQALYLSQGKDEAAAFYRDLGLKVRDKDPYFHAFLAKEALTQGRSNDAVSEIRRAIRLQRMEPDFYLVLAQAELNRGERAPAEKAVEKAIHWSRPDQRQRMESKLALLQGQT